jgi:SurA N-terminal domain
VGPGDRRDGQPLIFGWGQHLTRAEKQKYRQRFVFAGGLFIFALIVAVIGVGALQQYFFKPRVAVARVNGDSIERQWYEKNLAYSQFVLQHETQDVQSQFQALVANQKANAAATATANPQPNSTPSPEDSAPGQASAAPSASPVPNPSAEVTGTPSPAGSPTSTPTPAPTFNPQESATVAALSSTFAADQARASGLQEQTVENLIDDGIMRQNAAKFGISVSPDEVSAQAKKVSDQLGGDTVLKQLFEVAHLSQGDFNQIQYNTVLTDKFQAYFADHPDAAPTPSATPVPSPSPTIETTGPVPPAATPSPTPVSTPGADSLDRWLEGQRQTAKITRAPFPLPS